MWRRPLVAGILAGALACFVGPAALLAVACVLTVLPYLVKRKCPACGAKSLRQVRPGLFRGSYDCTCPCGYRETGRWIKTSWGIVAALLVGTVLFAAYVIVRYGR